MLLHKISNTNTGEDIDSSIYHNNIFELRQINNDELLTINDWIANKPILSLNLKGLNNSTPNITNTIINNAIVKNVDLEFTIPQLLIRNNWQKNKIYCLTNNDDNPWGEYKEYFSTEDKQLRPLNGESVVIGNKVLWPTNIVLGLTNYNDNTTIVYRDGKLKSNSLKPEGGITTSNLQIPKDICFSSQFTSPTFFNEDLKEFENENVLINIKLKRDIISNGFGFSFIVGSSNNSFNSKNIKIRIFTNNGSRDYLLYNKVGKLTKFSEIKNRSINAVLYNNSLFITN